MATITDFQIRELCRKAGLVEPFNSDMINPASIDVTLGPTILVENYDGWDKIDISKKEFSLPPKVFVLAHTAEVIRVPTFLEAVFQLKSSRGREGYEHSLAGYIDPGFTGQVTLELTNLTRYKTLPLKAGMRIGQLRFMKVDHPPHRPYSVTGRYNNDMGAQLSKG